jgi:hypothetical protein
LERLRILAIVGKFVTARMPQHVRTHPQCAITAENLSGEIHLFDDQVVSTHEGVTACPN